MMFNMRAALVGLLAGAASAKSFSNTTTSATEYTTEVVTAITTYCPAPTTLTHDGKTYTVTEATTLTITDCPCTVSKPVKPTETAETAYTTEVVTAITTYCPAPTTLTHGTNTYTVTEPTTLTITDCPCTVSKPVEPTATPETAYTTEVVTELTTYCPAPTTITHGTGTYTVTEPTTLTITDCPCTISKPVPSHPVPTAPADCPAECTQKYNECRSQPHANMATCAAEYSSCLGYSPFANGTLVTPTACSHKPGQSSTAPGQPGNPVRPQPTSSAPATCPEECAKSYNECRSSSGASHPACASEYASCLGYNPFGEDGSLITPTACSAGATGPTGNATSTLPSPTGPESVPAAGAEHLTPFGALMALGAIALL